MISFKLSWSKDLDDAAWEYSERHAAEIDPGLRFEWAHEVARRFVRERYGRDGVIVWDDDGPYVNFDFRDEKEAALFKLRFL